MSTEPLNIVAKKGSYPNLFEIYAGLSDREYLIGDRDDDDDLEPFYPTIGRADFKAPLEVPDQSPFAVDSNISKFLSFVWNMFDACETGGVSGDACRLETVLVAAINDVAGMADPRLKMEHLLGLTIAIYNQGLDAFFERGDEKVGAEVFGIMAREWKEFFGQDVASQTRLLPEAVRKVAVSYCAVMKKRLKSTKDTYGEDAPTYEFDYNRSIPGKRGGPSSSGPSATKKTKTN